MMDIEISALYTKSDNEVQLEPVFLRTSLCAATAGGSKFKGCWHGGRRYSCGASWHGSAAGCYHRMSGPGILIITSYTFPKIYDMVEFG